MPVISCLLRPVGGAWILTFQIPRPKNRLVVLVTDLFILEEFFTAKANDPVRLAFVYLLELRAGDFVRL